MSYEIVLRRAVRRTLSQDLPETVAVAVWEFLSGPLAENPHRVGKPLSGPYEGYHGARRADYRVIYVIQEARVIVEVVKISHRLDAYRP